MGSSKCLTVWKCAFCNAEDNCKCDLRVYLLWVYWISNKYIYHRVNWPNTLLNMGVHTSHTPDSMIPWRTALLNFLLNLQAEDFYSNVTVVDEATLAMALDIVSELAIYTDPTSISIFPRDLNTSNYVITNTVDLLLLSLEQSGTTDITAVRSLLGQ